MRNVKRLSAVAVALVMVAAVLAGPALGADTTVGRFVQELAKVKNLNATDARIAVDSLRAVGVRLPATLDLNKRLTERDVAEISRVAGLRVTTSNPDALFSADKMDRFFQSFGPELALTADLNPGQGSGPGNGQSGPPFDPFTKARGKGKGKAKFNRTPSEPE